MSPQPLVVGLTGPNASGKSEVAGHLVRRHGFTLHSLSDVVREEASRRGLDHSRRHLIAVGNDLRREQGPAVLARRLAPRIGPRDVVDSIRNPLEAQELRRLQGFRLLGLDAPVEIRYQRARRRRRIGDAESLEGFVRREEEENSADPAAQQLRATLALADHLLVNDRSRQVLLARVDALLGAWEA